MTSDVLSRLRAGLAASEDAANFALELERPYREMTDQTAEISYEWVRHTRLSNGGSGAMFVDGAPAPDDVLRMVEAIRKVIARYEFVTGHGPAVDHTRAMDMTVGATAALRDVIEMLASAYTIDEMEKP